VEYASIGGMCESAPGQVGAVGSARLINPRIGQTTHSLIQLSRFGRRFINVDWFCRVENSMGEEVIGI